MFAGFASSPDGHVGQVVVRRPGPDPGAEPDRRPASDGEPADGPVRTPAPARRGERDHVRDRRLADGHPLRGLAEHLGRELLAHRTPRSVARSSRASPSACRAAHARRDRCRGRRRPGPRISSATNRSTSTVRSSTGQPARGRPPARAAARAAAPGRRSSGRRAAAAPAVVHAGTSLAASALQPLPPLEHDASRRARRRRRCRGRAAQVAWQRASASRATGSASAYVRPQEHQGADQPGPARDEVRREVTVVAHRCTSALAPIIDPTGTTRQGSTLAPIRIGQARVGQACSDIGP